MDAVKAIPVEWRVQVLRGITVALLCACATFGAERPAVVRSGCEVGYPPFCMVDAGGQAEGYSVELLRAALKVMGREVTFRTGTWSEVRGWLERGEVDALPLVGRTPEREALFDFTVPYLTMHGAIVVRKEVSDVASLADLRGRRVGVMLGDNTEEFLRREDRGFSVVTWPTFADALRGLLKGECDAVVIQRLVGLHLLQEAELTGLKVLDRPISGFAQDFCFAVRDGDRELLAVLNEGLSVVVADGTQRRLHAKWFAAFPFPSDRPIVVGGDDGFPPFEFLDERGRPSGFSVELTRAIASEMGVDVQFRLGAWNQVVDELERGDVDVVQGMFYSEDRDRSFDFSQTYLVSHYVSVVRGNGPAPRTLDELAGLEVIVQEDDLAHEYLVKQGFRGKLELADTQEDALRSLAEGSHDCAVVARLTALALIKRHGWTDLSASRGFLFSGEYCYAVANGQSGLLSEFDEGLAAVEASGEYRRLRKKWLGMDDASPALSTVLLYIGVSVAPVVAIAGLAILWSWALRRKVGRRTAELSALSQRRAALLATVPDIVVEVDANKVYTWANAAGKEFFGEDLIGRKAAYYFEGEQDTYGQVEPLFDGEDGVIYVESRQRRRDGVTRLLAWHCRSLKNASGEVTGVLSTARDITDQRKVEQDYRTLFHEMLNGFALHEILRDDQGRPVDYRFLAVNPAFERMTGLKARDVIGKTLVEVLPDGAQSWIETYGNVALTGEPAFFERHADALGKWFEVASFRPAPGQFACFFADITARKKAEEALAAQYRLLRVAGETARFGGWSVELATGRVEWSDVVAKIHGMAPGYSPGLDEGIAFYAPEWQEKIRQVFTECAERGVAYDEEMEILTAAGDRVWVRATGEALRDSDGRITRVQGSFQDISLRKRQEARLESLSRFASENPNPVLRVTARGDLEYANDGAKGMLAGIAEADPRRLNAEWRAFVGEVMRSARDQDIEVAAGTHTYTASVVPVAEHGYVNIYARDITDMRVLESQLRQAQKMEAVGRLAGGVAHDFNNILMGILNYAELCRDKLPAGHRVREWLDEITSEAQRSANLTRQLLAFARKQTIAPTVLDINEAIGSMLKMLRRLIGEDIDLSWQPCVDGWTVRMDPGQVDQILVNLCVNARDAIGGAGKVTIETDRATLDERYCEGHAGFLPGDFVVLAVSDDGRGMDHETQEHLFEPFFTTKDVGAGTGMGLATVYGIVKQNEGFINVYSEPGEGTTFRIYLPRCRQEPTPVSVAPTPSVLPRGAETILLVEDEKSVRVTMRLFLRDLGYTVLEADCPAEAIRVAAVRQGRIALLITDVVMPGMSGRELAERLRREYPTLACIYMSGYTANVIAHRGILDEGVDFLAKPVPRDVLAQKVRDVLDRSESP